jgi:hypothetical protein
MIATLLVEGQRGGRVAHIAAGDQVAGAEDRLLRAEMTVASLAFPATPCTARQLIAGLRQAEPPVKDR